MDMTMRPIRLNGEVIGYWDPSGAYHRKPMAYPYGAPRDAFKAGYRPTKGERRQVARLFQQSAAMDKMFGRVTNL